MSGITLMFIGREASAFAFTISSNQTNANLATLATAAGWNGTAALTATIGSGVYISSNSTGTPALTVSGSFPGGVTLVNNGFIYGMGGAGGGTRGYGYAGSGYAGSAGGLALSVSSAISITNNGTIGGGGGGGGGGGQDTGVTYGGGGGGGISSFAANSSGGYSYANSGGAGTYTSAGSGGAGTSQQYCSCGTIITYWGGNGGAGGSRGASGSSGGGPPSGQPSSSGGSGGGAVSGNSNITWVATGTRLGSIT